MAVCLDVMDRPWKWGEADCCTAACDVFLRLHGVDPMAPLRGAYSSDLGAVRAIKARGGFLMMARELAAQAGLERCEPEPGAIGVVRGGDSLALAICTGPAWAAKSKTGMATVPVAVECWRCPR